MCWSHSAEMAENFESRLILAGLPVERTSHTPSAGRRTADDDDDRDGDGPAAMLTFAPLWDGKPWRITLYYAFKLYGNYG